VTIKTLLFLLFLYICLVWVGAAYLNSGPDIVQFGLKWTAVGLIAVFGLIVGSHLFSWWRRWRAKPATPKAVRKPEPIVHEDDAALAKLIAEANNSLRKAPGYGEEAAPIYRLPWRLLMGPENSGKSSTFLNSELEPQLLAGRVAVPGVNSSGQICNLWLAKNTIFAELSGKAFDGDLARWTQLLGVLRGTRSVSTWRRLLGKREPTIQLRGVIGFCDLREFTTASADPQRFERYSRNWQDRLKAVGDVFGVRFPVYLLITKCDGIPFFQEFFHAFPESDTRQVLGCTLPFRSSESAAPGEIFAEAESKRITTTFRALYQRLSERRLTQLAYENSSARRAAIYQFPRELKRIRGSVVQFLVDAFRPDSLRPGPLLRGYYFTGVREVEMAAAPPRKADANEWATIIPRSGQAVDATQMFKPATIAGSISREQPKRMTRSWSFASDLFNRVVMGDVPLQTTPPVDPHFEIYRRRVLAGVVGGCALFCFTFFLSWVGNRNLINDVEAAAFANVPKQGNPITLAELRQLDGLRLQTERLRNGANWWLHLGLYSGDRIMDAARTAYFRRFHALILDSLSREMTTRLKALPATPAPDAPYEPVYRILKTHLIVSSAVCRPEPELVSEVLKDIRNELQPQNGPDWRELSDRQIDFYANELSSGDPVASAEDKAGVARGRGYLQNFNGLNRIYSGILTEARKSLAEHHRLSELAPNYGRVLRTSDEVPSVFSIEGWQFVEKASKEHKSTVVADCALGDIQTGGADAKQTADLAPDIQRLFVHDYIESWKKYLDGSSVIPYSSAGDAAQKLEILSSNRSPLLALLLMTSNQTNFPSDKLGVLQQGVESILKKVEKATGRAGEKKAASQPDTSNTPAEIALFFQPAQWVEPPASDILVNEKNTAYTEALSHLQSAMQKIAEAADPQASQAASQAALQVYDSGLATVAQIARGFKLNGADAVVQRLLEEPITRTKFLIESDPVKISAKAINNKFVQICQSYGGTFKKYPFTKASGQDATLDELSAWFAPNSGQIWKFRTESLGESFENAQWKPKDPSQQSRVTPEMMAFLNRAQEITTAFYPKGAAQPQLTYVLRPKLDSSFKTAIIELEVDGQLHRFTTILQEPFTWPAAPGAKAGAAARIRTDNVAYAFDSHGGLWGIFRMFNDAQPRAPQTSVVEWKFTRVGDQQSPDPIQPGPVRMEFPEFPSGADVFHSAFFDGLKCPSVAVR
jgi:type VI secretion system protein ImpL